jgi:hypothetical protein
MNRESAIIGKRKERGWRGTYQTRLSRKNYKGIGLRENGEVDVGSGTHECRTGVADHKYFCVIQPPIWGKSLQGRSHLFSALSWRGI